MPLPSPLVNDPDFTLYVGDALDVLSGLPDASVHAIATSPPFYGLRDYGTGSWDGGRPDCPHTKPTTGFNKSFNERWMQGGGAEWQERQTGQQYTDACPDCGATRTDRQIGRESSPEEWAAALVDVFREGRRVLRDDGTLWIECGDSFCSDGSRGTPGRTSLIERRTALAAHSPGPSPGLKQKDLVGAPWLLAFMLRADGWFLRGVYVWEKPDAMPDPVTDRCVIAHSYILHLAKSGSPTFWTHRDGKGARKKPKADHRWIDPVTGAESDAHTVGWKRVNLWRGRDYFFDLDAIREPFETTHAPGSSIRTTEGYGAGNGGNGGLTGQLGDVKARLRAEKDDPAQLGLDGQPSAPEQRGPDGRRVLTVAGTHNSEQPRDGVRWPNLDGRSPRSVWRIATEAASFGLCPVCRTYWEKGAPSRHCGEDVVAHFAVWPHKLAGKIIDVATSAAGACADCGAPRYRVVRRQGGVTEAADRPRADRGVRHAGVETSTLSLSGRGSDEWAARGTQRGDAGWGPSCGCDAPTVPCTVLDPFIGSATTARQARALGRRTIGVELSPDYAEIAMHRTSQLALISAGHGGDDECQRPR